MKVLATNKKAKFNYEILDEYVAGIQLEGREVKSLRKQKPNFEGSYVTISNGKPYLYDLNIPRYSHDSSGDYSPKRRRLLLLKKPEIERIEAKLNQDGFTVVPLAIGFERQWVKISIGIGRGKKLRDKRRVIQDRQEDRRVGRLLKNYGR